MPAIGLDSSVHFDVMALESAIKEYVRQGGNVQHTLPAAANILLEAVDYMFDTEGAAGNTGTWQQSKRAEVQDGKTLQDTGNLAGSMTTDFGTSAILSDAWFEVGTNVPYSVYHLPPEKSGHPSKGIMPVRDFFDVKMEDVLDEVTDLFLGDIVGR